MVRRLSSYPVLLFLVVGGTLLTPSSALGQIGAGEKEPVISKKKNKNEDLPTQVRGALRQPPAALEADATHLSFLAAPLSARGLLSQQTREALRYLIVQARGAQFVRLRAFVAGTGDLRRVPQLVSEIFADRHLALPVVTTVQAGLLGLDNAQVLVEATLQQNRVANPDGVRFVSAEGDTAEAALAKLKQTGELLRATCYVPALEGRAPAEGVFLIQFIQPQKLSGQTGTTCEGVTRGAGGGGVRGTLVFTGEQMAFGYAEADARLAFERLEKTLASAGCSLKNAVVLNFYPLSRQLGEMALEAGQGFLDPAHSPAGLRGVVFEGLPSMDGAFAIEVVAAAGAQK
jgi:enamine deaminase RidA (YjgF/YER057c/UK114 family)